ncbi:SDR family oxidoreductase [Rheinheimera riviphila]|uniref:SDR family oxidoreductase n=1 Tax=Rheinheimera riviphila TaxID=1834037 RepID=A0A437QJ46_9GAMM|nr:SDR family oxidoreductase [Rheinheimera riviphila]RVU34494.1 SDR family oxidoreductase [Rheinheimera riviphila]
MVKPPLLWITGAAGGVGQALMAQAKADGFAVLGLDRCVGVDAGVGVDIIQLDLTDSAAVTAFCQAQPQLPDLLIHAAGVLHPAAISDTSDAQWRQTFAVNADSAFYLCRALLPHWQHQGNAAVVLIASNAGRVPRLGMAAYGAAKAALAHFGKTLALELAASGGRCNVLSPGSTDTAMLHQLWQQPEDRARTLGGDAAKFRLGIPLGRIADASQVAQAALFLVSSQASHITMQELVIDGGATLGA